MCEITFQKELFTDVIDEAMPLIEKHYNEIAHFKDIPLDPDIELYKKVEDAGVFHVFTARMDGILVGYAAYFVKPNPHYKTSVQAVQDVLYVDPDHRGFGKKFIDWIDLHLSSMGVQATYQHTKAAYNFGPLLERLGYVLVDHIYVRRLS